jgi:two-component sensor histidine kinase
VLVLAPLGGDERALMQVAAQCSLPARAVSSARCLDRALQRGGPDGALFVVATHEACGRETGAALQEAFDRDPSWARLPTIFLVSDAQRPPAACRMLDRRENAPPAIVLERPAGTAVLRRVFEAQAENRRRQFATRDLLDRLRASEQRQHFLLEELRHRTRNSLAVLQAIFMIAARRAGSVADLRQRFVTRLQALSRAHSTLTDEGKQRRSIGDLVSEHLAPYCAIDGQMDLDGPDIMLRENLAFDLALIIHELATNAAKHGALSRPEGSVTVRWQRLDDGAVSLVWAERGGPPVIEPPETGLGFTIINRPPSGALEAQSGFAPEGLVWRARIEPSGLADGEAPV